MRQFHRSARRIGWIHRTQAAGCSDDDTAEAGTTCLGSQSNACSSAGSAEKGIARANISSVHSGFSSSISSGFGFSITTPFLAVCLPQTDNPQSASTHGKNKRVKNLPDTSKSPRSDFTVILAGVDGVHGRGKVEFLHDLKANPTLPKVTFALTWVVRNLHAVIIARNRRPATEDRNSCQCLARSGT